MDSGGGAEVSRECTTHHHACACREAKFAELEKEQVKLLDIIVSQRDYIAELDKEYRAAMENLNERDAVIDQQQAELERLREQEARLWRWVCYLWADYVSDLISVRREGEPPLLEKGE